MKSIPKPASSLERACSKGHWNVSGCLRMVWSQKIYKGAAKLISTIVVTLGKICGSLESCLPKMKQLVGRDYQGLLYYTWCASYTF